MALHQKLIVSTDSGSYLGPILSRKIWSFLNNDPNFLGFELSGWRWSFLFRFSGTGGDKPIVGIHGRLGDENQPHKLLIWILNLAIIPTSQLIKMSSRVDYILIHEAEYHYPAIRDLILNSKDLIKNLFIENVPPRQCVEKAVLATEEIASSGIKGGMTFDIGHFIGFNLPSEQFHQNWQEAMDFLKNLCQKGQRENFQVRIHLPVGTNLMDSLPIEKITDNEWLMLKKILDQYQLTVVIETIPTVMETLLPFLFVRKHRQRNQKILEKLTTLGVL